MYKYYYSLQHNRAFDYHKEQNIHYYLNGKIIYSWNGFSDRYCVSPRYITTGIYYDVSNLSKE